MSQFSRTVAQVDALEEEMKRFEMKDDTNLLNKRKEAGDKVSTMINEIRPSVNKFIAKAEAGERDPNKRIYGTSMVSKIFSLRDRFQAVDNKFSGQFETVKDAWDKEQARIAKEKAEEEEKRKRQEEEERIERERREEEERLRKEAEAKAAEEQRKKEEEIKQKEKQLELEIIAKKKEKEEAEEEERKRLAKAAEEEAERKKKEEEEKEALRKKAEEDKMKDDEAGGFSISIKTALGKTHSLSNVKADQTVGQLKEAIEKAFGVNKLAQRLIFQGRLLADANTVSSYKISSGSAIHMVENARAAAASSASRAASTPATAAPKKWTVAPGTVCHLANGKSELDVILAECAKDRLVVIDWFAPWCGPCRMIAPGFERLATRFTDVTFVKVDTEASLANSQLAAEKQITAYPTFHYIINKNVVHSFSGANASNIESGIKKYRAMIPRQAASSSTGGASSSAGGGALGPIGTRVMSALSTLQRNLSMDEFVIAVRTLLRFVKNMVEHPGEARFRRVRTGNATFQSKLGSKQGGIQCMHAFGFRDVMENGEAFLVISAAAAEDPELRVVMSQLESAVQAVSPGGSSSSSGGAAPSAARAAPTPAAGVGGGLGAGMGGGLGGLGGLGDLAAGLGGMGGLGGADGAGGMDPSMYNVMADLMQDPGFQQMARELMTDPEAMNTLMHAQQAFNDGDMNTVQQLQNHPAMQRMNQAMSSNPAFISAMMRQMAQRGFPGLGGGAGAGGAGAGAGGAGAGAGAGFGGMPNTANQQQQAPPAPPAYPGAPSTEEEEQRLLQEAIRLSMQDQQQQGQSEGNDSSKNDKSEDKSN